MKFDFYNVTSIHGLTFMITVVCANTIMLWLLPTEPKKAPVCIIHFILTTPKNKQHPQKNK